MRRIFLIYILMMNSAGLILMAADKIAAVRNGDSNRQKRSKHMRIPEATLIITAAMFGAFGIGVGMKLFRHKIKKPKFYITVPILFVANAVAAYFLYTIL